MFAGGKLSRLEFVGFLLLSCDIALVAKNKTNTNKKKLLTYQK